MGGTIEAASSTWSKKTRCLLTSVIALHITKDKDSQLGVDLIRSYV